MQGSLWQADYFTSTMLTVLVKHPILQAAGRWFKLFDNNLGYKKLTKKPPACMHGTFY